LAEQFSIPIAIPGHPGVYLKDYDIYRVINAQKMGRCIAMRKLDLLAVPDKYFYRIGDSWRVLVEHVEGDANPPLLSLPVVQQLTILTEETGYRDWGWANWVFGVQGKFKGKFVCRDMELASFGTLVNGGCIDPTTGTKAAFVEGVLQYKNVMEPKALQWLQGRIAELQKSPAGLAKSLTLVSSTQFDDPEIDSATVKNHYSGNGGRYCDYQE